MRDNEVLVHDRPNFHCLVLRTERVFRCETVLRLSESDNLVFRVTPNFRRPGRGRGRQRLNHEAEVQHMEYMNRHSGLGIITDDEGCDANESATVWKLLHG